MLLSTALLLQPLHNKTHQWDYVIPLVVSCGLRIKGTEPCMSGPATARHTSHSWEVPSPSSWLMPSPSWHCTVFSTVPLLLMLISAEWVTYLFPCCLPLPTEHNPQGLLFCLVCSLLSPQLQEQHSLSRTGFSEDLLSELVAGTCFWPAPQNGKHCTSRARLT